MLTKAKVQENTTHITNRLKIRPLNMTDASKLRSIVSDEEIAKTTNIPYPYREGLIEKWIKYSIRQCKEKKSLVFVIVKKADDDVIGALGLDLEDANTRGKIWFWLARKEWSQGYCTEAVKFMLEYAFENLQIHRIYAHCLTENVASAHIFKKLGFKHEGCLRKHCNKSNVFHDVDVYGILFSDYK